MRTSFFSGAGNSFVMIDGFDAEPIDDPAPLARDLCERDPRPGGTVRPDGLVLLLPSSRADCAMRIYNRDGSRPEACGNGLRCAAKLAADRGRVRSDAFAVETDSGVRRVRVLRDQGRVTAARVEMGRPKILSTDEPITVDGAILAATVVDVGNPHCVLLVEDERTALVESLGPRLERHPRFPSGTNVEFLARREGIWRLRVWERGVGETQACGSGACASAAVLCAKDLARWPVAIALPGGTLEVDLDPSGTLELSGPVAELA